MTAASTAPSEPRAARRAPLALLLRPGLALMRRLGFAHKLGFMALVLLLPLGGLLAFALATLHDQVQSTRQERAGSAIVGATLETALLTQTHRGTVNLLLAGGTGLDERLRTLRQQLGERVATLDALVQAHPELQLQPRWQPLRAALQDLAAGHHPAQAPASFALHSQQISALIALAQFGAETSGLLLDPHANTYQLMNLGVQHVLPWTEALGRLRGLGAGLVQRQETDLRAWLPVVEQRGLLLQTTAAAREATQALVRAGEAAPAGFDDAAAQALAFATEVQRLVDHGPGGADGKAYFEAGTRAIEAASAMGRATTARLNQLLDERARRLQQTFAFAAIGGVAALLAVVYLSLAMFHATTGSLTWLQRTVAALARGDFTQQPPIKGRDEIARIGQQLDAMGSRLSEMVADVRSNASMVTGGGLRLAADTRALNERTEAQAASLEQTSASVQELTGAVQQMAGTAQAADQLAAQVRSRAEAGGQAIGRSVATMRDIQGSSRRVEEIVGVIEGIAFQTNLLALNAAVEAARAGEQGRGFAVVAGEVRTLAQRSSAAAREIKVLIQQSVAHVDQGAQQVAGASDAFSAIVQGIREVAEQVRAIAGNASEQSTGLQQISQAVGHIDELTQRNAQMVEQAMQSSEMLNQRAERLTQGAAEFRLRQGSADEAQALVQRAVAMYRTHGRPALEMITRDGATWADRDMYIFALDPAGTYRCFAGNTQRCGTSVRDVPGVDGLQLTADAFERAAQGGGWVDYRYVHPVTGEVRMKTSYVEAVEADLILGCGVYKLATAAPAEARLAPQPAQLARAALAKAAATPATRTPVAA